MAILEYASNLSQLFDLLLIIIAVATAGFAIKVKFINEARKAAKEGDDKREEDAKRMDKMQLQINSCEKDISYLKGVDRSHHEQ